MKSLTFLWLFIDLSPFCLTVKWLKSHKKSRKKSRKSEKVNRLFMTFSWLRSQLSVKKSQEMFLDFLWLFFDWVVKFHSKKIIKKSIKVIDCILTFFDFFLTLKSEKVTPNSYHTSLNHMIKIQNIFFVQKTPPTTNSLEKELMVVDKMTKAALSSLGMEFGIVVKKRLAWFNWGNGKKKKKRYSIDNGLKVLLRGELLCLRCLHDGLDDVYKL